MKKIIHLLEKVKLFFRYTFNIMKGDSIREAVNSSIEKDTTMKSKKDEFKDAQERLVDALEDFADDPEKYAPSEEFAEEYCKKHNLGRFSESDNSSG